MVETDFALWFSNYRPHIFILHWDFQIILLTQVTRAGDENVHSLNRH